MFNNIISKLKPLTNRKNFIIVVNQAISDLFAQSKLYNKLL
jgi:hypothetical protein